MAFPSAKIIGVDYSNRSTGIHSPDFNDVWLQQPWTEINLAAYAQDIRTRLDSGALWLSALDLEIHWLSNALPPHPRLLLPTKLALERTRKPAVPACDKMPLRIPPFISSHRSDWDLHAFCRKYGWEVWLKGPYYDAKRVKSWAEFDGIRTELQKTWSTQELSLQAHVRGFEQSIVFTAYQGKLLESAFMEKRDITPEGKTWAGQIHPLPEELLDPLRAMVQGLEWTGGAELEMVRDPGGVLWLMELNPRFPAWIHGATLAGKNFPGRLVQAATGLPMMQPETKSRQFARIVLEMPIREGYPLPPLQEPAMRAAQGSGKYPSDLPQLAERLTQMTIAVASQPPSARPEPPSIPETILEDLEEWPELDHPRHDTSISTPRHVLLRRTANAVFANAAQMAERAGARIAYSIKTNPDPRLLALARENGFLAEAISALELKAALENGFDAGAMILNGPGKLWPQEALSHRPSRDPLSPLRIIFCDSVEELCSLQRRFAEGEVPSRSVGVRLRVAHAPSRFGIDLDKQETFAAMVQALRELPPSVGIGCHFHIANSHFGVEQWWGLFDSMLKWASAIETCAHRPVGSLDIGGGWFPDDFSHALGEKLALAVARAKGTLPGLTEFVLEPGKALVQPVMALAVRVLEVRRSDIVVDGSVAELPMSFLYPHRILRRAGRRADNQRGWHALARGKGRLLGRICMENDILASSVELPLDLRAGELLAICDSGAYDRSMTYAFGQG